MKKILSYSAAALIGMAALSSCGEDFTYPPVILPSVDVEPTVTLEGFKNRYWSSLESGPSTIGFLNSEHKDSVIFTGRVCSSDETGNIYKNIVIQSKDENGEQIAITFAVNSYDLYQNLPFGQEVAVYATGLQIGGFSGLLQFGAASGNSMTFMDEALFTSHVIRNHTVIPHPELVDTTVATIPEIIAAKGSRETLCKWQSRLIRIDKVSFAEAGQTYAGATSTNRYIVDADGNRLIVRNSSYADFAQEKLPYGTGSVTGILSYFGSDWQILLINTDGVSGFDGTAPDPVEPDAPTGDGTAASPFNVAKVLQVGKEMLDKEVYVKGKIASITEVSTSFGNATFTIADKEGDATFLAFRGYWLGGARYTSADQIAVGADVVLRGSLTEYNGTLQLGQGYTMVSYNGQTSGENPPAQGGTLYSMLSESLSELPSDWTIENVALDGVDYVWSWKTYNEKGYLNASAYVSSAKAAEAYCISPVLDLTGATDCSFSFDHAAKFQTTLRTLCGVVAREEGATEWTALTLPGWPEAGSWTFSNSGDVSLKAFDGKKVQIAFRYKSSTEGADTWEIKNLVVKGTK